MMTTKRNIFSLPYATDMASTSSMYHRHCTTHTTKPVAHVAYEIVFQSVFCLLHDKLGTPALVIIDIGLKPKLSAIPVVYDYYDAKF